MVPVALFFVMYAPAFLLMLLLTILRSKKAEVWVTTCLSLLWLIGISVIQGFRFMSDMGSAALPWTLGGVSCAVCILWAIGLSSRKEKPNQPSQPIPPRREV